MFRLVLPLCGAEDAATAVPGNGEHKRRLLVILPPPAPSDDRDNDEDDAGRSAITGTKHPSPAFPSSSTGDENCDYAEDPAKFVRLRRYVAALRACRMITVWPADDEDRMFGR